MNLPRAEFGVNLPFEGTDIVYYTRFGTFPKFSEDIEGISESELNKNILKNCKLVHKYFRHSNDSKFFFFEDILISVYHDSIYSEGKIKFNKDVVVKLSGENLEKLEELSSKIKKYKIKPKQQIGILFQDEGLYVKYKELPSISLNTELNYGTNFVEKHKKIIEKLDNKNSGLYIFHGKPGTGKSSYIRYLTECTKRKFIFIPNSLIDQLTAPSLTTVISNNENAVFVIEDAEKAIVSRENGQGNESLVSTLLNISDGIFGSLFNISLLITFNTEKDKIDKALLRKGRLSIEHEFNELSIEEAQKVADSLNIKRKIDKPMVLADIYNIEDETFYKEKEEQKIVGFAK